MRCEAVAQRMQRDFLAYLGHVDSGMKGAIELAPVNFDAVSNS